MTKHGHAVAPRGRMRALEMRVPGGRWRCACCSTAGSPAGHRRRATGRLAAAPACHHQQRDARAGILDQAPGQQVGDQPAGMRQRELGGEGRAVLGAGGPAQQPRWHRNTRPAVPSSPCVRPGAIRPSAASVAASTPAPVAVTGRSGAATGPPPSSRRRRPPWPAPPAARRPQPGADDHPGVDSGKPRPSSDSTCAAKSRRQAGRVSPSGASSPGGLLIPRSAEPLPRPSRPGTPSRRGAAARRWCRCARRRWPR